MNIDYPLSDVIIREVPEARRLTKRGYADSFRQVNNSEFAMQVASAGNFYARDGNYVEYAPSPGADREWIRLYLNGQVLVALLHQRRMLNFHASSFIHNGRGIMIMGETGAGKSSLTASFILDGAGFLSDDLTPVVFRNSKPFIKPLSRTIRLRDNTVSRLNIGDRKLTEAEKGTGKQYLHVERAGVEDYLLSTVLKIEIGNKAVPEFLTPEPMERFSLLRSEICSWEILAGMPETETDYLQQLLHIVQHADIVRVVRPADIEVAALHAAVRNFLAAE